MFPLTFSIRTVSGGSLPHPKRSFIATPHQRLFMGKDADHAGTALYFPVEPFNMIECPAEPPESRGKAITVVVLPHFYPGKSGFPAASLQPERKPSRFSHGTSSSLCGISLSACPRGAARYFPCTDLGGIGSEKGKGACQRPVSEFIHVSILNFAAPGNSRSENEVQHRSFVTRQEAFSRAMTARIVGRGCTLCGSCPCGRFYSLK